MMGIVIVKSIIIAIILAVVLLAAVALIVKNTGTLNEQKALRAELADMVREADEMGTQPTDEQIAALQARIGKYEVRWRAFKRSPFVIDRH